MLAIFSLPGFEQYFLDLTKAVADSDSDRAALGAVIGRLRQRYGDQDWPE
jgi:hypothetical protein